MAYEREEIESLRPVDRPKVRCSIDRVDVGRDGGRFRSVYRFNGRIDLDGNIPWLVGWVAGEWKAFCISWGLLLEVLNDPYAPPVHFLGQTAEYQT